MHPSHQCRCKSPGYCQFFKREQSVKDFKLCKGEVGTQEQSLETKKEWAQAIPLPPLTEQAGNFMSAMLDFVKSGLEIVDKETYGTRVQTCKDCLLITDNLRCRACGCWVEKKSWLKDEPCPHNFWPEITPVKIVQEVTAPAPQPQFLPAKSTDTKPKKKGCPCRRRK